MATKTRGIQGRTIARTVSKSTSGSTSSATRIPGQGKGREIATEKNAAPSQWGRRMARLVGEKFRVKMVDNHARNEGTIRGRDIVIKCAKSLMPPVSILCDVLDRVDEMWAVYVMPDGHAEVWSITSKQIRDNAYFTHGPNVQRRAEIYYRHITPLGKKVGELTEEDVEYCRIP
jgi:hypothetical protein